MNTKFVQAFVLALLAAITGVAAQAQSAYSNAVMSLNPVAYWPLQETTPPPMADVETNIGSLGSIANAYYASTNAVRNVPGAIAGDSDPAVNFNGGTGAFAIVPTTDHRVSLPAGQPFTVECWTRAASGQSYRGIITQTGPNNAGGLNGVNNSFGWSLNLGFGVYRGTGTQNNPLAWTFHVFNGNGFTGGAEAEAANNTGWLTGGTIDYTNAWVYLAGVFDGTNCWLYVYSTNLDNANWGGTNLMNVTGLTIPLAQLPITTAPGAPVGGPGTQIPGATFAPDTWDPIMLAATRGVGGNEFIGYLDEVAIYTNALSGDRIASHFDAGTNGLGNYSATVMADHPYMYWRMNAPKYVNPPVGSYPTAANYGSAGASMTNFNTLGTSAVYQPGTLPGVAGPSYSGSGFGALTNACAFNGLSGAVDAGYNSALDPTGTATNLTLVAWFKANPMDNNGRWNCLASHTDSSWKAQFKNGVTYGYKGAGSQAQIAPTTFNVNDDQWHMYVLQATYTNGVSTNVSVSLDDGLATSSLAVLNAIPGKPTLDAFIGGAPDSGYIQPTNGTYNANQQYFAGRIAHVAYFNYALSSSQISNLFFTAKPVPTIFTQPVTATVDQGKNFTNTVLALPATYPLSYQWYKDGAPLPTQTGASLILNPVRLTDASTNYFVVVTNTYGAATSGVVSLTVRNVPLLSAQFPIIYTNPITLYGASSPGILGSSPTFSIFVTGAQPLIYQWKTNGVAMAGATNASLTFTNCQMTGPTNFLCVVTNLYGSLTSFTWKVTYAPAPTAPFPQAVLADRPICYWRLNDPDDQLSDGNPGAICTEYQNGNDGLYTNIALGLPGYNAFTDPTETAAQFSSLGLFPSIASWVPSNIDFSLPAGSNGEFTVAVWANGNNVGQAGNAGLVTKGLWGFEQFTLDEGATGSALRFTVRNAPNTTFYSANSSFQLLNNPGWHFVVGVCDQANGRVLLYIDGQLVGTATIPIGTGILSSAEPLTIGARKGSGGAYNNQFWGFLNDVAVYNYALSSNQILHQVEVAGIGPIMTLQPPGNTNASYGGVLVVPSAAFGTPPLFYQWFDENANAYIDGQTNATLVLNNIQNSDTYYVTVTNAYGSVNSTAISVNVIAGSPQIITPVKDPFSGFLGQSAVNSVEAYGTMPLHYQWQFYNGTTWVNLTDNGRISGSQSNALKIANVSFADAGSYQVVVSNGTAPDATSSGTLTVLGLPVSFYGDGSLWTANGSARAGANQVSLTDPSNGGGQGSFFFPFPQYIGAFQAAFTYQAGGNRTADGVTFCLQNDPRGPAALGGGGGQLGVGTASVIAPSAELEMNIYTPNTMGYAFDFNGNIGPYTAPGAVQFQSGDPINVTLTYAYGQAALTFTDAVASKSYSASLNVGDLTQILGADTAYVGFTGSFGGSTSVQTISDFAFVSLSALDVQVQNGTNVVVSWPGTVVGYGVQQNASLSTTNWLNVTNPDNVINGQHQVVLPLGAASQFYRLKLQQ
ncbi:MAG TPA: LamG-like jellyroll fold domain-containing protein [Candidatus Acidoferrum sp.]|nr:LamG-like jellyroll fold domain-containing protein [Candidatus Acidoferrum sp.]